MMFFGVLFRMPIFGKTEHKHKSISQDSLFLGGGKKRPIILTSIISRNDRIESKYKIFG